MRYYIQNIQLTAVLIRIAGTERSSEFYSGPIHLELVDRYVVYKFVDSKWMVDDVNMGDKLLSLNNVDRHELLLFFVIREYNVAH